MAVSSNGLSTRQNVWLQLMEILRRTEWYYTKLDITFQQSIPKYSGIYLLVTDRFQLSNKYNLPELISTVIYVGKSSNLHRRFKQHSSNNTNPIVQKCKSNFGTLRFAFTRVPSGNIHQLDRWLREAERQLIIAFDPPANRTVPRGMVLTGKVGPAQSIK